MSASEGARGRVGSSDYYAGDISGGGNVGALLRHSVGGGIGGSLKSDYGVSSAAALMKIEALLMQGKREDAANLAAEEHLWPLALIIGGVCPKQTYQSIVKRYADQSYGAGGSESPSAHLFCLLFSDQAESSLKYGGKILNNISFASASGADSSLPVILKDWWKVAASILANKGPNWTRLLRLLAYRLLHEKNVSVRSISSCFSIL